MTNADTYRSLLNKTYLEVVSILLKKYGAATDSYYSEKSYNRFKNGEIKTLSKRKISRTGEGLYCHHIDEDKQILISQPKAILKYDIPFDYQKQDRLVYCDLIEHAILHILISIESYKNRTIGQDSQAFGIGGYINYLRPELIQWLVVGAIPTAQWRLKCLQRILMDKNEAIKLIEDMDNFLMANYPISPELIEEAYEKSLYII